MSYWLVRIGNEKKNKKKCFLSKCAKEQRDNIYVILIDFNLKAIKKWRDRKNVIFKNNSINFSSFFCCYVFFSFRILFMLACRSLGLTKIKTPPGHHRKRLAVESSRHHSRPDDSHMFIIKLPPNPYYYANSNTAQNKNGIEEKNQKVRPSIHPSVDWEHIHTLWLNGSWTNIVSECIYRKPFWKLKYQPMNQIGKRCPNERISAIWQTVSRQFNMKCKEKKNHPNWEMKCWNRAKTIPLSGESQNDVVQCFLAMTATPK